MEAAIPEALGLAFALVDFLPAGMQFLDDGTTQIAFVSNIPGGLIFDPIFIGAYQSGDETNLAGIVPAFDVPASRITVGGALGDPNDVTFDLGLVINAEIDANREFIVIEFNALVTNEVDPITPTIGANQAGDRLDNTFQAFTAATVGGTPAPNGVPAPVVSLTVAEPQLVNVVKDRVLLDDSTPDTAAHDAGDLVRYRLRFNNNTGDNVSTAYEVHITDAVIAANATLQTGSIRVFINGAAVAFTDDTLGNTLDITVAQVNPGDQVEVYYDVILTNTIQPGQTVSNTANLTYTSLPGAQGTTINPTGSSTPGASGDDDGERNGDGGVNDYVASASHQFGTGIPEIAKDVVASSVDETTANQFDPDLTDLAVGEEVTYVVAFVLPEGTNDITLTDILPGGGVMRIIDTRVLSIGGNISGALLVAGNPATSTTATTATFDFGIVINAPDNVVDFRDVIVVEVTAQVMNVPANNAGDVLTNTATLDFGNGQVSATEDIEVVEPQLELIKEVIGDSSLDAGDTVTYQVTLRHTDLSTAIAFNIDISDTLPAGLQLQGATIVYEPNYPSQFWLPPVLTVTGNTVRLTAEFLDHPDSPVSAGILDEIVIQYTATVLPAATLGAAIVNTATAGYDSYFEDSAAFPDESRPYTASDTAQITVNTNSIAGFVYRDLDNDGVREAGETGIGSVTVVLTGTDHLGNTVNLSTLTAPDGSYSFAQLRPGSYTLTETQPAGFVDGRDAAGTLFGGTALPPTGDVIGAALPGQTRIVIPDDSNAAAAEYNFGELAPATIGDFVWLDVNGNGRQDGGEGGVEGIDVTLAGADDAGNTVSASTTTSASGAYSFSNLRPGTYTITFGNVAMGTTYTRTVQNSPVASSTNNSDGDAATGITAPIVLVQGQTSNDVDQGLYLPVTIGDRLWYDINGDGVQDGGEPGLNGVTVILDDAGLDNQFNTADDVLGTATQTTSGDGAYLFDDRRPGLYRVRVNSATLPNGLNLPTFDLDGVGTPNQATSILASGQTNLLFDFGYRGAGFIGDRLWFDTEFPPNGIDNNEPGVPGVTVTLTWFGFDGVPNVMGVGDDVTYTDVTDLDGFYGFANLPLGSFSVSTNATTVYPGVVSTYDLDSGPLSFPTFFPDGVTAVTLSAAAPSEDGADFGFFPTNFFGDRIYLDLDGNGTQGAGEPGLANVLVQAIRDVNGNNTFGDAGDEFYTRTTGALGFYLFVGLPPGRYQVQVDPSGDTLPAGLVNTGDPDGALDSLTVFDLAANDRLLDKDWGYQGTSSLSGFVYRDFDLDGIRAPAAVNPETGIPNVTITLQGTTTATSGASSAFTLVLQTAGSGAYNFSGLPAGDYTITETQPPDPSVAGINGFYNGFDTLGTIGGVQTGANPDRTDNQLRVALPAGQSGIEYNFGEFPPADPFGFVYIDLNENGIREAGEPGIQGVSVTVSGIAFAGTALARPLVAADILPGGSLTVITDASGRWEFLIMPPGTYSFTETQPLGFDDGDEEDADPNGPPATVGNDVFSNVILNPFPVRGPFNFGEIAVNGELRGTVYADRNNNGFLEAGEVGLPGVTVILSGTDVAGTSVNASVVTDAAGNFAFTRMRPGTYQLNQIQPPRFLDGLDREGTLGGNAGNDVIDTIVMAANQVGVSYLFGEQGWLPGVVTKRNFLNGSNSMGLLSPPGSGITVVNPIPGGPLRLAGAELVSSSAWPLRGEQLDRTVNTAFNLLSAAGLDPLLIERLRQLSFQIADLPGTELGRAFVKGLIVIDRDAAGHGWSLGDDFDPDSVDLLSVVLHELGHELGLKHAADGFMSELLELGSRRLPALGEIDALLASHSFDEELAHI